MENNVILYVDGVPVRLKEPHDFSFLKKHGQVFCAFDENDSGNISFGLIDGDRRRFIKYAGANTINYNGEARPAIERLETALPVYEALQHPVLIKLIGHEKTDSGFALVFDWADGECLHAHWNFDQFPKYTHPESPSYRIRRLPIDKKLASLTDIFSFHQYVAGKQYVAIDFYDGSILYDFKTDRMMICDIDFYQKSPVTNTMGRMWGSSRFMSPEEYVLGAQIDELTNVFTLGAITFEYFGDSRSKSRELWEGPAVLYEVVKKAISPERDDRFQSIAQFIRAWEEASRNIG